MKCEIIAVGSELLTPFRMDTNSLYLTEEMNQLGVEVIFKSVVGDDFARLVAAAKESMHVSQCRRVKRAETRGMQRLRDQQQRQVVRAQRDDRKADTGERETRDQHLPQRERAE